MLAVVMLMAVGGKLASARRGAVFSDSVAELVQLTSGQAKIIAVGVVAGELGAAILLVLNATALIGFAVVLGLLCAYIVVLATAVRRGRRVSCSCFGGNEVPVGTTHIVRNIVLSGAAVAGLLISNTTGASTAGAVAVAAVTGGILGLLFSRWDELDFLVRAPELAGGAF